LIGNDYGNSVFRRDKLDGVAVVNAACLVEGDERISDFLDVLAAGSHEDLGERGSVKGLGFFGEDGADGSDAAG
jgi:hypothetical protein